mgnify:CR=1 FL=1
MNLHEDAKMKIERKEEQELEILGEILEAYVDTPIKGTFTAESSFSFRITNKENAHFAVDDRFGTAIEMPEHVEYMTVQDVLDQLNGRK